MHYGTSLNTLVTNDGADMVVYIHDDSRKELSTLEIKYCSVKNTTLLIWKHTCQQLKHSVQSQH